MKQITNIALNGFAFAVEEDAYEKLSQYLDSITRSFDSAEDRAEIIADIEIAIAEKFQARNLDGKRAVTMAVVEEVMAELGTPAQVSGSAEEETETTSAETVDEAGVTKRLYRDTDDAVLAGVASGIAQYFGIDPVIVRIMFVVSVFFNGLGILAYVILWLVVPAATTTSQRYAMRGTSVTISAISNRVKKNLKTAEGSAAAMYQHNRSGVVRLLDRVFAFFGSVLRIILGVVRIIVGIVAIVLGVLGLAAVASGLTSLLLFNVGTLPAEVQTIIASVRTPALYVLGMAVVAVCAVPLLVSLLGGISLLLKRSLFSVVKVVSFVLVWVMALAIAATLFALQYPQLNEAVEKLEAYGVEEGMVVKNKHYRVEF